MQKIVQVAIFTANLSPFFEVLSFEVEILDIFFIISWSLPKEHERIRD